MKDIEDILNNDDIEQLDVEATAPSNDAQSDSDESTATKVDTADVSTPEESSADADTNPETPAVSVEDLQRQINAFKTQALDERRKRQALQQQQNSEPMPDVLENQDEFVTRIQSDMKQAIINERANLSEHYARKAHENFDELWVDVESFLAANPQAYNDVMQDVDPYGKAIAMFNQSKQLEEMKDPQYLEKLEEKIEQRLLAKLQTEQTEKAKKFEAITPSLATQTGAGSGANTWSGPTPMSNLF